MLKIQNLFTPLSKKYCDYFYILSIIFFGLFVIALFTIFASMFDKKPMPASNALILLSQPLILYFINRLYYSMCVNSLSN